ncbi:hypothetical protein N7G274_000886 [Stereocaulon virgatum]|uniref:Uncharacterized protein n=1 Tax=Stereocaulon virgatum TaxID=373712 RepID=A0ABR4ATU0_9LECA
MADQWLSQTKTNPHLQKPEPQAAINIIHNVITDQLSPLNAATKISHAYEPSVRQNKADLWSLWTILIDAISRLGGETTVSQCLAEVLAHLSKLPDVVDANGDACKWNGKNVWRDLPDFSFYFSEQGVDHILIENIESSRHGATVHDAATKLTNINTFAALYLCELDPNGPPSELSSMRRIAREHFMYTLEIPFDTPDRIRRTELYIAPAVAWIDLAGPRLHQFSESNADYTGEDVEPWWIGRTHGGMVMWDKRDGFSLERWAFWKKRFREFSVLRTGSEEAKMQAAKAARRMQMIDGAEPDVIVVP